MNYYTEITYKLFEFSKFDHAQWYFELKNAIKLPNNTLRKIIYTYVWRVTFFVRGGGGV